MLFRSLNKKNHFDPKYLANESCKLGRSEYWMEVQVLLFEISKFGEDSSEKSQVLSSSPSGKKDLCDAAASKSLAPTMSPLVISSS